MIFLFPEFEQLEKTKRCTYEIAQTLFCHALHSETNNALILFELSLSLPVFPVETIHDFCRQYFKATAEK